ncbi:hypothetical protein C8R44DRAFT_728194 [Mycena epipterygia]|nr:hypothetical protein C8R44DRAFT_728194 [Mycena epipterygia]
MGRRAKHLTAAAKASAGRQAMVKYRETHHAKVVQSAANQAAYLFHTSRKDGRALHPHIPRLPRLLTAIFDLQKVALPEGETLFTQALASTTALDETDLETWKKEPPFADDGDYDDPHSVGYHRFTHALSVALHGVQMREQNKRDIQRCAEFDIEGWESSMGALREEVKELLLGGRE